MKCDKKINAFKTNYLNSKIMHKFLQTALFFLMANSVLSAQPGTLDATFGTGGKVIHSIGQKDDWAWCAALQPDGKVVAAGYSTVNFTLRQAVTRFLPNGTPDPNFGMSGNYVSTTEREVLDVALQADGKIVTCGFQLNSNFFGGFAVSRLTAGGAPDATFGTNGSVRHAFGKVTEKAQSIAVQADGKIVAAGFIESSNNNYDFALIRVNTDGSLDPNFGTAGKVTTQVGTGHDVVNDMLLLPDGKILVCGNSWNSSNQDRIVLARYNTDGSLDNTFGTGGIYIGQNGQGIKIMRAGNGQILLAGRQVGVTVPDAYLWRFSADGVLDNGFGTNGLASVNDISLNGAALQTDGKILITGLKFSDFATARLSANGALDAAFGTGGVVTTNVPQLQQLDQPHEVLVQSDGKIVAVGESYQGTKHNMSMVRYLASGSSATDDWATFAELRVFPNPVPEGGSLNIALENDFIGTLRFDFIALDGRVLETFFEEKTARQMNIGGVLNPADVGSGAFFLRVSDGKSSATRLVLKL